MHWLTQNGSDIGEEARHMVVGDNRLRRPRRPPLRFALYRDSALYGTILFLAAPTSLVQSNAQSGLAV